MQEARVRDSWNARELHDGILLSADVEERWRIEMRLSSWEGVEKRWKAGMNGQMFVVEVHHGKDVSR